LLPKYVRGQLYLLPPMLVLFATALPMGTVTSSCIR
jgi:hypothetical protein